MSGERCKSCPARFRSARGGGNLDPGLRTSRDVGVVGADARTVVPGPLSRGLLLDVHRRLGMDDHRRGVRRVIPPVWIREERRDADEHAAPGMEMMEVRGSAGVTAGGAATPPLAAPL